MQVRDHEELLSKPLLEVPDHCLLWAAPIKPIPTAASACAPRRTRTAPILMGVSGDLDAVLHLAEIRPRKH